MKKVALTFVLLSLGLFACGGGEAKANNSNDYYTISNEIGIFSIDQPFAELLWGGAFIPKEIVDEDVAAHLLPGDYLSISYEEIPGWSQIVPSEIRYSGAANIEALKKGKVVEVYFKDGKPVFEDPSIVFDQYTVNLRTDVAIAPDGSVVSIEGLEKGYASLSAVEENKVRAIFVEDPRVTLTKWHDRRN